MRIILLFLVAIGACGTAQAELRISAFNVKFFNYSFFDNPEASNVLIDYVSLNDVIVIQEVQDEANLACPHLLSEVNIKTGGLFDMRVSVKLGEDVSFYYEQYAIFYRTDKLVVLDDYYYQNLIGAPRSFYRPPYMIRFATIGGSAAVPEFAFIPLHAKPDRAPEEVDKLVDAYDEMTSVWGLQEAVILGDFNAACDYMSQSDFNTNRLWNDPRFLWLIDNNADTTVSTFTDCAYDRLVVAGPLMQSAIIPGSAQVFDFLTYYNLEWSTAYYDVSDHYPVDYRMN